MEYPDYCITTIRMYCKEGGCCGRWACKLNIDKVILLGGVFSGHVDLKYDRKPKTLLINN